MRHLFFLAITLIMALSSCNNTPAPASQNANWAHTATVADVIQTSNYTNLEVNENGPNY